MTANNNKYYDCPEDDRTDEQLQQDVEIMEALSNRHYFVPQDDNNRFCKICDKYMTDFSHHQVPPSLKHNQAI